MALSKDDVLNAIAEMSVMDIVELISDMEEKFGVTAAVAAAPAAAGPAIRAGGLCRLPDDAASVGPGQRYRHDVAHVAHIDPGRRGVRTRSCHRSRSGRSNRRIVRFL